MAKVSTLYYPSFLVFEPDYEWVKVKEDVLKSKSEYRQVQFYCLNTTATDHLALYNEQSEVEDKHILENTFRTGFKVLSTSKNWVLLKHPELSINPERPCVFKMAYDRFNSLALQHDISELQFKVVANTAGGHFLMCEQELQNLEVVTQAEIQSKSNLQFTVGSYYTCERVKGKYIYAGINPFNGERVFIPPKSKMQTHLSTEKDIIPSAKVGESHLDPNLLSFAIEQAHLNGCYNFQELERRYTLQEMTVQELLTTSEITFQGMELLLKTGLMLKIGEPADTKAISELFFKVIWHTSTMQTMITELQASERITNEFLEKTSFTEKFECIMRQILQRPFSVESERELPGTPWYNLPLIDRRLSNALQSYFNSIRSNPDAIAMGIEINVSNKLDIIWYSKRNDRIDRYNSCSSLPVLDYPLEALATETCYVLTNDQGVKFIPGLDHNHTKDFLL